MTTTTNRVIYLVTCGHSDGAYMPERAVSDWNRATTVKDIADGQFKDLLHVLECNFVDPCRDATKDIARDVMTVWADNAEPLAQWQIEFVEMHVGFQAAASFVRAAA